MEAPDAIQSVRDQEHLRLLSIFYFISAGLSGLFVLFPMLYAVMGAVFVYAAHSPGANPDNLPPEQFGWIMFGLGIGFALMLLVFALLKLFAGFWIRKRRHRVFVLIVAGLTCLEIPYGTLLGVFTFIVLGRSSVAALFASTTDD